MAPIAVDLELDRLRYREARLVRAVAVLEARAAELLAAERPIPAALSSALAGFRDDLAATRAQLR
jgi:hypothetical protein